MRLYESRNAGTFNSLPRLWQFVRLLPPTPSRWQPRDTLNSQLQSDWLIKLIRTAWMIPSLTSKNLNRLILYLEHGACVWGWDDETLLFFFFQSSDWIHAIWQLASVISHRFYFWTAQSISKANSQAWIVVFFFLALCINPFLAAIQKKQQSTLAGTACDGPLVATY